MPSYKLTYFHLKAQAEPTRYLFQLAGVEYEDKRVTDEEWAVMKPSVDGEQLPVLEVDGKVVPQSGAIARYVATQHGLYPTSTWDQAQVDVVIDTVMENDPDVRKILSEKDEMKEAEFKKQFAGEGFLKVASRLEELLKKNNNGTGWFLGDKITLADVMVFSMYYDLLPGVVGNQEGSFDLKQFELLKGFMRRFKSEPKVTAWIDKRPKTPL